MGKHNFDVFLGGPPYWAGPGSEGRAATSVLDWVKAAIQNCAINAPVNVCRTIVGGVRGFSRVLLVRLRLGTQRGGFEFNVCLPVAGLQVPRQKLLHSHVAQRKFEEQKYRSSLRVS